MQKADIVLDATFGDFGKGKTVDWLLRSSHNEFSTVVVRFSGGQQCGHKVVHDDKKHVHSSFPSGALSGHCGYISEHCTIDPTFIKKEYKKLQLLGCNPELVIHPMAKVTTIYDIAYGQHQEFLNKHGSCGFGVGATMKRNNDTCYKLTALDLTNEFVYRHKIAAIKDYYNSDPEFKKRYGTLMEFKDDFEWFRSTIRIADYDYLDRFSSVIFEGSQGIMLDMDHGFFPHVTYANTTSKNVWDIWKPEWARPTTYYGTRAYGTRHGNGPMPMEEEIRLINTEEETNSHNEWQKDFRTGHMSPKLILHAVNCDKLYNTKSQQYNLCVTCLDQLGEFNTGHLNSFFENCFDNIYISTTPKSKFACLKS